VNRLPNEGAMDLPSGELACVVHQHDVVLAKHWRRQIEAHQRA